MYLACNAFTLKSICRKMVITDLVFVHVLIVNLKGMGWQLLCFVQFPVNDLGKNRKILRKYGSMIMEYTDRKGK